jgi:hypothetical protein
MSPDFRCRPVEDGMTTNKDDADRPENDEDKPERPGVF